MNLFSGLTLHHWNIEARNDGILIVSLDRQGTSVNTLGQEVLNELNRVLERIVLAPPKGVIFRSNKKAGFIAGADIAEFAEFDAKGTVMEAIRNGQLIFQRIAELPCPTVAVIHGHCMGGGTELSLACTARVASNDDSTRIGLPEVKLGIYPGWGGSVRLPRLVGAPAAFDMMLTGRALKGKAAQAIGLVDAVTEPALMVNRAVELIERGVKRPFKQRALATLSNSWLSRRILPGILTKQVARKARKAHYPAPYSLIQTWQRSGGMSVQNALLQEAKSVVALAQGPTARNLTRIFFLMERLKSLGGKSHGIEHVHVIGAGVMGGDIAAWCALRGFAVTLQDREMQYIQPAMDRAEKLFEKKIKDPGKRQETHARLQADVDGNGIAKADLIIEAIFENQEAKQALYASLEPRMKASALLVSNTSSIALSKLAERLQNPAQFAGLHYFNPVAMMPLVEIVRHDGMDAETERRLAAFCKSIDKLPVPVAGSPGFLVNRILAPYMQEALLAFSEGIPGRAIDAAALDFGMPMGPIELVDTVGLDVAASVGKIMAEFHGQTVPDALQIQPGKRGKKDGEGLYRWVDGKAVKPALPKDYRAPELLQDRLVFALLNEAVSCLDQGVVADADLLDAGVIFGTGFAPFRGGPMEYIKALGRDACLDKLQELQAAFGDRFKASAGWEKL